MELLKICPICGYSDLSDIPYDEYGYPTYVICDCCGYEFGFDDESKNISFSAYRQKWIKEGFHFFNKKKEPVLWNFDILNEQLKNISKVDYKSRLVE
jgi:hypothetical protein